jgi:hypothetical protein
MMHRIVSAQARPDYTVDIVWDNGDRTDVTFADLLQGEVCAAMRDPDYFVKTLEIGGGGDWLAWEEVDFSSDSLWYRAHPEALARELDAAE